MPQENIKKYHPLGNRTLFMFIFRRSIVAFFLFLVLCIALVALGYIPSPYIALAANIVMVYSVLVLIVFASVIFIGWLQYFRYWIFIDDKDLKIARGLIATEQIGVPYRHIEDIKIERSLLDQLFGVSDIVITVQGSDENESAASNTEEPAIILPALSKEIALEIQDIVLKKAQVQQVNVLGGQKIN